MGNSEVVVLIDPGATHNFVALEKVTALGLPITESGSFGVSLGNGETVKGNGVCKGVMLQLEGCVIIQEDFLPLSLGSSDVILGIQWLEQLGDVITNWKSQVMRFQMGKNTVTLVGDPTLVRSQISLKAMIRTLRKEKQGYWVEINRMEKVIADRVEKPNVEVPSFLADVTEEYKSVFVVPVGLPPPRGREHKIFIERRKQSHSSAAISVSTKSEG